MDILEDYFDGDSIRLTDQEQRDIILKTWVTGSRLCRTQVNSFRQEVHQALRIGKGEKPDHATRRYVSTYMQRHHKDQTIFDTEACARNVYKEVGYFSKLGDSDV